MDRLLTDSDRLHMQLGPCRLQLSIDSLISRLLRQDLFLDWSLMNLKCQHRFLRPDLVYTGHIPVCKHFHSITPIHLTSICRDVLLRDCKRFGVLSRGIHNNTSQISNILVRLTWIIFIPTAGPSMEVRSFLVALFEMFRRFQWNFCMLSLINCLICEALTSFHTS
jgi:hypothetical protein